MQHRLRSKQVTSHVRLIGAIITFKSNGQLINFFFREGKKRSGLSGGRERDCESEPVPLEINLLRFLFPSRRGTRRRSGIRAALLIPARSCSLRFYFAVAPRHIPDLSGSQFVKASLAALASRFAKSYRAFAFLPNLNPTNNFEVAWLSPS